MSEQQPSEKKQSVGTVVELATAYQEATDEEPDQERLNEIEKQISALEEKRSEVVDNSGEDNFVVKDCNKNIQELEKEREEIQQSAEDVTQCRNELLRAASESPGFKLDDDWLNPDVIRALTKALYGEEDDKLVIVDYVLREPTDAEDLDPLEEIQVKQEVMNLAQDRLSGHPRVEDFWTDFEGSSAYRAFRAIVSEPGIGPSKIADMYDDVTDSTTRNWTSDLSNQDQLKLVDTPSRGNYCLSTVGKYYAAHYANPLDADDKDDSESSNAEEEEDNSVETATKGDEATDSSEDSEQYKLGNSDEPSGEQSEEPTDSDRSGTVISTEFDNTEEKKQAMFDNIGRRSDIDE